MMKKKPNMCGIEIFTHILLLGDGTSFHYHSATQPVLPHITTELLPIQNNGILGIIMQNNGILKTL